MDIVLIAVWEDGYGKWLRGGHGDSSGGSAAAAAAAAEVLWVGATQWQREKFLAVVGVSGSSSTLECV